MLCPRCRHRLAESMGRCPRCGTVNRQASGTYQTSTVLISSEAGEQTYRSVEEVPAALRTQLLRSTNGANSATILIADRRGRREIARAMRNLPGTAQRRLLRRMLGEPAITGPLAWFTPGRRKAVFAVVAMVILLGLGLLLTRAG